MLRASTPDLFRALDSLELTLTQAKLLHELDAARDELSLKELAERLGLSLPAASRAVEGLFGRGYLERREDERDRRVKRVRISPAGADALGRLTEMRLTLLEQFSATMSEAERRRLAKALEPLLGRPEIAEMRPR